MFYQNKKTLKRSIFLSSGEKIENCYQCGKCTAGCPMTDFMDLQPHQIMHLLQLDNQDSLNIIFSSQSIWCCVSCETCSTRCPKEVRLSKIMDALRKISLELSCIPKCVKKIVGFHKAFLDSIRFYGRVPEFYLTINYKLRSITPVQDLKLAPLMKLKGKLHIIPHKIKGINEIKKIFKKCEELNKISR